MSEQYDLNWESSEDRDVIEILGAWERARKVKAQREFAAIGRTGQDRVFLNTGGMGGHLNSQIQADSFHYWGQRLGYQCWDDAQFVKEYLRDNEYARVKSRARNLTVSFAGKAEGGKVRSRKRFDFSQANFGGMKLAA